MSTQKKEGMIVTGAGQLSMAIARRVGFGMKIVMDDKSMKNAETIARIMNDAGFDVVPVEMDLSSQAPIEAILKVDLYGTAALLERWARSSQRAAAA